LASDAENRRRRIELHLEVEGMKEQDDPIPEPVAKSDDVGVNT